MSSRSPPGPDGNLWFTEFDNNKIGRITTAGVITEFLIPTADCGAYGITPGPDGHLWFTEFKKAKLGWVGVGDPTWPCPISTPTSGPAAGGTPASLTGDAGLPPNATVLVGLKAAGAVSVDGNEVSFTTPPLAPGTLEDVVVTDPADGSFGRIPGGWLADFSDVPQAHLFHDFVEKLVRHAVTAGCGLGNYCPTSPVTRAQMAVFLLRAKHGPALRPAARDRNRFRGRAGRSVRRRLDRSALREGITGGCGGGNYCPGNPVRRDQMAVFLLKAEHGASYVPPGCDGGFADVPCPSNFADWIEQLAAEGVTAGCGGGNYCPLNAVSRGQMAVFLTKAFEL